MVRRHGRREINPLLDYCPLAPVSRAMLFEYERLCAADRRYPPDAGRVAPLRVIEKLAVGRFLVIETTQPRDLHGLPARGRHLPNLLTAAPVRAKVNPLPVP